MKKEHAIVLLSGGIDSCVCLATTLDQGYSCTTLSFNYGQLNSIELEKAALIAKHYKCNHFVVEFNLSYLISPLVSPEVKLPQEKNAEEIANLKGPSPFTVSGRNTHFLAHAMSLAENLEISTLVYGPCKSDSAFKDCSKEFIAAFERLTLFAIDKGPLQIKTPLINLDKTEIIALGKKLNAPLHLTFSCYRPQGLKPCKRCHACLIRKSGFEKAGTIDPAKS